MNNYYEDLQLHMQSVPITTNVVSSNPAHGEVYSIQHYVIKFVSDIRQFCSFLRELWFPPPIKLTATNGTEILLKVALNSMYPNPLSGIINRSYMHGVISSTLYKLYRLEIFDCI